MKNFWNSIVLCVMLFTVVSNSYGQFIVDTKKLDSDSIVEVLDKPKNKTKVPDSPHHFGVWANYEQQIGALNGEAFVVGGPSFGFNLGHYFFIGGGVYSSFGNIEMGDKGYSMVYGGGIAGFRWTPFSPVVFRTQVLLGSIGFDTVSTDKPGLVEKRDTSFIVVPEVALDIRLVGGLFLTIAANYRHVEDLPDEWSDMKGLGALSGIVSLGLSF